MSALRFSLLSLILFLWPFAFTLSALSDDKVTVLALDDPASREIEFNGTLQLFDSQYMAGHSESDVDNLLETRGRLELLIPSGHHALFGSVEGISRYSDAVQRNDAAIPELYLDLRPELPSAASGVLTAAAFRIGNQIHAWGTGVLYNPTDNLTPWYAVDPFNSYRRGTPSVKTSLSSGLYTLDVIYLAAFKPTELPDLNERFFIHSPRQTSNPNYPAEGPPLLPIRYVGVDESLEPENDFTSPQFGARMSGDVLGWELGLSYFHGYENIAVYEGVPLRTDAATGMTDVLLRSVYPKEQVYGVDLAGYISALGVHFEGAYFDMEETNLDVGIGDEDYASLLAGVEYTFYDVLIGGDLNVVLEYAREIRSAEADRVFINRIYSDALLARVAYTYDYRFSTEVNHIADLNSGASFARLALTYQASDNFAYTIGYDRYEGPPDSFYGAYDLNDRLWVKAEYAF